jgi:CsoR family transcriptional regulator, copper-sensing transcriptional repressor
MQGRAGQSYKAIAAPEAHRGTIEGQVRGLQQMIENERDCVEIAHQINAVIAALRRVQGDMVRDHPTALAESSMAGKLPAAKARRLANDVGILMAWLG